MSGNEHPAPAPVTTREQATYVCLAIAVMFPLVLSLTMANVALPAIMLSVGMPLTQVQLLSTATLLAATVCALVAGYVWKRIGPRATVTAALGVFLFGSLVCAATSTPWVLIAGRIVQGAAAGLMQPLSLLIVAPLFPPNQRGFAMGLVGMGMLLAPAVSPAYAGWMVEHYGWRILFLSLCPWCLACLPFVHRLLPASTAVAHERFDWLGLALLIAASGCLLAALALYPHGPSIEIDLLLGVGIIGGTCFVVVQALSPHPLISLRLILRVNVFYCIVLLVLGFGIFGSVLLVPLLLQSVAGYTAEVTGTLLLPAGVAMAMASPFCGRACDRWSPKALLSIGLFLFALSSFLLADTSVTDKSSLTAWVTLGRIALAVIFPAIYALSIYSLPTEDLPEASSLVNFLRQMGGAFGTALLVVAVQYQEIGWLLSFQDGAIDSAVLAVRDDLGDELAAMVGSNNVDGATSAFTSGLTLIVARSEAFRDVFLLTGWTFIACALFAAGWTLWAHTGKLIRTASAWYGKRD